MDNEMMKDFLHFSTPQEKLLVGYFDDASVEYICKRHNKNYMKEMNKREKKEKKKENEDEQFDQMK